MLLPNRTTPTRSTSGAFTLLSATFIFLSSFGLGFIGIHQPNPFAANVVTQLRFDEGTGTATADASGNSHNAVLTNGASWTTGKYGQAVNLDGANNFVNIPDHADYTLDPTQSYTWSAWVKNNSFKEWSTVWSQTLNNANFFYFYAHTSTDADAGPVTNGISVHWYTGTSKLGIHSTNNVLTLGQWSYVTITYNGSLAQANRFTIYVNGADVTDRSDVVSAGAITSLDPTNIRIGSDEPFGEYLNGAVDEVRYYKRLLSTSEIQDDMNNNVDVTAPTVSLTAPSAGNVAGTINVSANASDNVGVAGVQFLLNGTNLGSEDLVAPYTVSWNTTLIADGSYTLTAKARDAAGNVTTSSPVIVNVLNHPPDTQPPTVSITSPASGNVVGTINVTASASDNVGVAGVQFLLNGVALGAESTTSPYSVSWNTTTVANGSHTLTARARDAAGNTTTSTAVIVTVNNPDIQAPAVTLTEPFAGTVSGTINVNATATDNIGVVGVQFLLDGANLGAEDVSSPYSVSWNTTTIANGSHTLTAKARDAAGNTTTSTAIVVTVNNPDIESPAISITSPAAGNVLGTINVNATATDNIGVVGVQFLLDGVNLSTEDLSSPYSISWNTTTVANGSHTLTAKARDAAGNTTTSTAVVVIVNNPDIESPVVSITAPAPGNVSGTLSVTASATDNIGVVGVQFLLDGANLDTEDVSSPYSISWNTTTIANGSHTLAAKARDAAGNITTSSLVIVTVNNADTQAPIVAITAPSAGNVLGTINVAATATDNIGVAGVQFLLDGVNLGTEDVSSPYSVSWNTTTVANGSHTLTARARDAAGNTTTSTAVIVTVNNPDIQAPAVTLTEPFAGTVSGTINVSATATDNIGVVGVQFLLDGTNLSTEDLSSPYSISWNTTTATNGTHTLTAKARDAAGNTTVSSAIIVTVSNVVSPANLIVALPCNEGTGTAVSDVSGKNHPGTFINVPTWTTGKYGQAINFNSANSSYVNIADHTDFTLNPAQSYTWSAWVKNTNFNEWSCVWSQTLNNSNFFYFYAHTSTDAEAGPVTNGISVHWYTGTSKLGIHSTNNVLTAGQWSYVTITYNGSLAQANRFTIYVNGTDVTDRSDVVSAGTIASIDPTNVRIGADEPFGEYLNGAVDEVRYYQRLLSTSEIQTDMNTPLGVTSVDNIAPAVSITAPAAGNVSGTINVTANASDNVGVAGVQFLLDGVALGAEDVSSPYSVSWNTTTIANGNHTLTAIARDAAGNTTTSSAIAVTVNNPDTQAPVVTITAPVAGTVSGTINVNATATDNIGVAGVQFLLDGAALGAEDVSSPYSVSWNTTTIANGNHTLTAVARDAAGNTTTSTAIAVIVNNADTQAPTVAITSPATGNVLGTINVTATATDNIGVVGVQFLLDGIALGAEDVSSPYSVSWNTTTIANGSHTLTAVARDAAGNTTTSTAVVVTVNNPDIESPVVTITAPSAGNVSGTINVTATATDNIGVVGVQFLLDGVNLGAEDVSSPYSVLWNTTTIANGSHTLTAKARDAAGNTTTSTAVTVIVNNADTESPVVTITAPSAGNVSGTINVTATATDNTGVIGVQFLLDGVNLGAEDVSSPYSVSWNTTTIANGSHTLTAKARDAAGNTTTSSAVIVTVNNADTEPPVVTITAPFAGAVSGTINVTATATDNTGVVGVQFILDGVNLSTEDLSSPYSISWNTATVANGTHTLTAKARDAAGNTTTSAAIVVTVTNVTTTNLLVALPCNEGTGTAVSDVSGRNHPGAFVNVPTWTTGKYGQGINLDRANSSYVNIPDHTDFTLNPAQNYTWSAWVKNTNFNEWSCVWSQTLSNTDFFYFYAHTSTDAEAGPVTNGISVHWYNGANKLGIHSTNNVLTAGQWSYVTITYNAAVAQANRFTIYVNGNDVTDRSDVVSAGTLATIDPTNIRIGADEPFGEYFTGAVDEVRYYNRLLSATEIQSDMNTPLGSVIDNTAPTVSISDPANGASVTGTINVAANASDNIGVAGVQFLLDGVNLGAEDLTAPYSVSWNTTTATGGSHVLTAKARDAAGNTTTSTAITISVNNDTQAPTVTLTEPLAGNVSGTINVSASASDNVGVVGVQFLLDGVNLGTEDLTAPYSISWNTTTVTNGNHTLTAKARDAAGNITTSASVVVVVNNDTQAPTIVITAPAAGPVSATINVTANATDNVGVVGVQFLLDGVNLGAEDVSSPYSVSWNTTTATNGNHTLTAVAHDAAGNTTTSTAVIVSVTNDTQAPTIVITAPAAGPVSATINVTANATDNVGVVGVQFLLDGVNLGAEDVSSPYLVSWNTTTATNGSHTLTAVARDASGNTTTSSAVVVTVNNIDTQAPTVTVTSPTNGSGVTGTINLSANATDNVGVIGVQFLIDGVNTGAEDLTAPYSVSWNTTTVSNGTHFVTAKARDAAGNTTTSTGVVAVSVSNAPPQPTIVISSPAYGTNVVGTIDIVATVNPNAGIVGVQFLLDGVNFGAEDVSAPFSISWNSTLGSNGTHTLTAKARDGNGVITTTSSVVAVSVINDLQAPTVSITAPSAGATVLGTINVTANATDNVGVAGVQFLLDGVALGAEDVSSPYSISWNTATTTNGNHILTARARDAAGNTTTSSSVTVSVNNDIQSPTVIITSPAAGNVTGTINVNATVTDNIGVVGVQFMLDGTALGAEDVSSPYSISWNTTTVVNGNHTLTAVARDAAGNTTTSSPVIVSVFNDIQAPVVNITSPAAGTVSATINVTATATDNVGVIGVQFLLDGVALGAEDLSSPYSISWNTITASNGTHTITAKARDAAGNIATSDAIIVTVNNIDTQAPTVTVTDPINGTGVTGTINLAANASDNVGVVGVQFMVDGVNTGSEDLTAPYSISWNTTTASNGTHLITAKARDAAGNTTTSSGVVAVSVSNAPPPPTIVISSPAYGTTVVGTINIVATVNPNAGIVGVQFLLDGVNFGAEDVSAPFSIAWNSALGSNGTHTLTAKARDGNGTITPTSSVIAVSVNNDVQAPTVSITAPSAGAVTGTITVTANATDNVGVAGVQFMLDGVALGTEDLTSPYSTSWNTTTATSGNHSLTAVARDAAGNTKTSSAVVVVVNNGDTQAPTITITAPSAGNIAGTVTYSATASDNVGVAGVQFLLNGAALDAEDLTAPYSIQWNTTTYPEGSYTLTARARDAAGNTTTSSAVIVNVLNHPPDTEAPTVTITSPVAGNVSGTINVSANANDNTGVAGVQFLLDGVALGAEDVTAPYSVSWITTTVANGNHTLTARARDAAGNTTTSASVVVNVNNQTDTQAPTVTITSPVAGNVSGTVNVAANANDNIAVVGVQFLLDGVNLGAEDVTAPYAVSWNTTTATTGSHVLTAKARDAAGNTTTSSAVTVNVVVDNTLIITGVNVSSITTSSAVINWNTSVAANSMVNYGTTTTYGLSTLIDPALVTSHSEIINGLTPGTVYHYQVISVQSNGTTASSSDNTFTATGTQIVGSINGHNVLADANNKIIPWTTNPANGYITVVTNAWNYLLNAVPNDPSTGKPAYYSRSYLDPNTQEVIDWPHNPAGLYGMLTESALKYYYYSNNTNVVQLAENVATWHLDHGMTLATDSWASVPYASSDAGSLTYGGAVFGNGGGQGDGVGFLQPDKIGELGFAWLELYKYDGNVRFRDAAIQAANVLASKVRTGTLTQSPWPFRVNAHNNSVREQYCSNVAGPLALLDGLIASGLGDTAAYRVARTTAWNWVLAFPMQNNVWAQYFEDVPIQSAYNSNFNQYNAMMMARYLLEHPELDANWQTHVRGLITWVETTFGTTSSGFGATLIKEQTPIFPYPMGSHTSRYASVNALLYDKTGDATAKEKAYRSFNWSTYMARTNGVDIDGPDVGNEWFTDGYGDYIRHFMTGLAAVPEWTPSNETHILRTSSVVKNITYGTNMVSYTSYDPVATEVLHVNFTPTSVTVDGVPLQKRTDLTQPGWTLDIATKALRIYHTTGTQVVVSIAPGSGRSVDGAPIFY